LEDVALIRKSVSAEMRIKASGGIYTLDDAIAFLRTGADQLGVSKGAELIQEFSDKYPHGVEI
jgi:deoxyribose-phosphate aldolase